MKTEELISLNQLCQYHEVEMSFFSSLIDIGLIEIHHVEQHSYLHRDSINDLEKMIRMHRELNINAEGIDTIFNLLQKIDDLQRELNVVKNRLRMYEG